MHGHDFGHLVQFGGAPCRSPTALPVQASAGGPRAALRVVSLGGDAVNRGPSFDMDLAELQQADGSPIPYEDARAYFKRDPAHRCAAPLGAKGAIQKVSYPCSLSPYYGLLGSRMQLCCAQLWRR